jgi:hypothetical protein
MEIRVTQCDDREEATVEVVNPETKEVLSCTELTNGQSVTVTSVNAHDPSDIQVGEVNEVGEASPANPDTNPNPEDPDASGGPADEEVEEETVEEEEQE